MQKPGDEFVKTINSYVTPKLYDDVLRTYQENVQNPSNPLQDKINSLQRDYTRAQLEVMKEKTFYPEMTTQGAILWGRNNEKSKDFKTDILTIRLKKADSGAPPLRELPAQW